MAPRMMAMIHPAALFYAPENTEISRSDWGRASRFLDGTWPESMPPIVEWTRDSEVWDAYEGYRGFMVVDTEYVPDTKELLLLGIGAPDLPVIQWWPGREDAQTHQEVRKELRYWFADNPIVFQNCMADIPVIEKALNIGYKDYLRVEDTMFLHSLLWCEMPHNLEFLARIYGRYEKMKHLPMTDPLYNAGDVAETIAVWQALSEELSRDSGVQYIYNQSLLPLVPIILEAQALGIKVNRSAVREAEAVFVASRAAAVAIAEGSVGWPLNIGSLKQLKEWLSYDLQKPIKSIDQDSVSKLRSAILPFDPDTPTTIESTTTRITQGGHPVLEARVLFSRAQQYLSHYVRPMLDSTEGRVYAHFHPWAQNTGRWSTVDPPLAQLPHELRGALVPDPGWEWVEFDWSSIELRLIAALTGDNTLLEAFAKDLDVHTINCCEIFGWQLPSGLTKTTIMEDTQWVSDHGWQGSDDDRRTFAKTMVYRLCYGGKAQGAPSIPGAQALGLTDQQLIQAAHRWINAHPLIKRFWSTLERTALKNRQVRTFLGRRWNFLGHDTKRILRQMSDFPMQGAVADIMNMVLIEIKNTLNDRVRLAYSMHDSLKLQVRITDQLEVDVKAIVQIAEAEWEINGVHTSFPVELKRRRT